jgi:hypothetical protein
VSGQTVGQLPAVLHLEANDPKLSSQLSNLFDARWRPSNMLYVVIMKQRTDSVELMMMAMMMKMFSRAPAV